MFFALFKKTTLQNFNIKLQRAVSKPQSPVNKTFRLQRFVYKPPSASFEITKSNSRITWGGSFVSKPNRLTISWWLGFVVLYPPSQETWLPLDQNKSKHRGPILQKSLPSLSQNHEASPRMNPEITEPSYRIAQGGSFLSKPSHLIISWWLGFVILGPLSREPRLPLNQNKSKHRGPILQKSLPSISQNHEASPKMNFEITDPSFRIT